jgi:molybdopterin-binding protein
MSKISLAPDASGTGIFTIASPNSNTNRTLTLPDNTGTIITSGTAGTVLQVVEGSTDAEVAVSTTVYTDTGLTASITPSSASNKVLVIVSQQATLSRSSASTQFNLDLQLLRGATVLEAYEDYVLFAQATGLISLGTQICITYLDSPSTTSSTTYKMQGRPDSTASSLVATFQLGSRGRSSIILMEIAA